MDVFYGVEVLSSRGAYGDIFITLLFIYNNSRFDHRQKNSELYCNFLLQVDFFLLPPLVVKQRYMLTSYDIFSPAATIACTWSAERKQSGYCGPLGWPAPIQRVPTPPAMTTRGIDMHCRCICASVILWFSSSCPSFVFFLIYPWSYMWWQKMISCPISLFVKGSSQLWRRGDVQWLYTPACMLRHRAFCVADVSCMYAGRRVKCW